MNEVGLEKKREVSDIYLRLYSSLAFMMVFLLLAFILFIVTLVTKRCKMLDAKKGRKKWEDYHCIKNILRLKLFSIWTANKSENFYGIKPRMNIKEENKKKGINIILKDEFKID